MKHQFFNLSFNELDSTQLLNWRFFFQQKSISIFQKNFSTKTYVVGTLMSTHNMFSSRNKKIIYLIPTLI